MAFPLAPVPAPSPNEDKKNFGPTITGKGTDESPTRSNCAQSLAVVCRRKSALRVHIKKRTVTKVNRRASIFRRAHSNRRLCDAIVLDDVCAIEIAKEADSAAAKRGAPDQMTYWPKRSTLVEEARADFGMWQAVAKNLDMMYSDFLISIYGEAPTYPTAGAAIPVIPASFPDDVTTEIDAYFAAVCTPPPRWNHPAHELLALFLPWD